MLWPCTNLINWKNVAHSPEQPQNLINEVNTDYRSTHAESVTLHDCGCKYAKQMLGSSHVERTESSC